VLRIMKAASLLQPRCLPTGKVKLALEREFGSITPSVPNIMWGFDSTELLTTSGRTAYLFIVIEHWNSEVLAWLGTFEDGVEAAKRVITAAIERSFGEKSPAMQLSLRLDHWQLLTSPTFTKWLTNKCVEPCFILPMQPEGNGIAERFFRTLKEEVSLLPGSGSEDILSILDDWLIVYNRAWLLERLGYRSPEEVRVRRTQ
jgi:transposase InsO family protein